MLFVEECLRGYVPMEEFGSDDMLVHLLIGHETIEALAVDVAHVIG